MNGRYLKTPSSPLLSGLPSTGQGIDPYLGNQLFGVWTMKDYVQAANFNIGPTQGDANYNKVVFLCNMQPDIRSTSHFGSFYNETDNGQPSTELIPMSSCRTVLFGNYSLRTLSSYTNMGLHCSPGGGASWAVGSQDFTLEGWVIFESTGNWNLWDCRPTGGSGAYPDINIQGNVFRYFVSGADRIIGTTVISPGTWYHVAVCRVSGNTKMFVQGVQEGATYVDATVYLAGGGISIGNSIGFGNNSCNAAFSSARHTVGFGRYPSGFTPPTTAFAAFQA